MLEATIPFSPIPTPAHTNEVIMPHEATGALRSECDFCSAKGKTRCYDASPIVLNISQHLTIASGTTWDACNICSELIDSRQWAGLKRRVTEAWIRDLRVQGVFLELSELGSVEAGVSQFIDAVREAIGRTA
jgi:hypothetical protein